MMVKKWQKLLIKNGSEELGDAWRKRMRLVGCSESDACVCHGRQIECGEGMSNGAQSVPGPTGRMRVEQQVCEQRAGSHTTHSSSSGHVGCI